VQEVFDKRTLHHMLGVEPLASTLSATTDAEGRTHPRKRDRERSPGTRRTREKTVEDAWAAESDHDDDNVAVHANREDGHREKRKRTRDDDRRAQNDVERERRVEQAEDEDESRYAIVEARGPPTKRRRMGTRDDVHTVFTADEDSEAGLVHQGSDEDSDNDSLLDEEAEYASGAEEGVERAKEAAMEVLGGKNRLKEKRAYWLSKGIGAEEDST
jgi:non-canonical poly(A) RNA polymerase PAPD5/7